MIGRGDHFSELVVVGTNLHSNHALSSSRHKNFGREHRGKKFFLLKLEPSFGRIVSKPFHPGLSKDGRVPLTSREFLQPRRNIPAKIDNLHVRSLPTQLMFSSNTS